MTRKTIALLLCFFFGWTGAHWYYLNRPKLGALWTVTLGFLGIGAFINFFQLLFMSQASFNSKYAIAASGKDLLEGLVDII